MMLSFTETNFPSTINSLNYNNAYSLINTGDILLVSGNDNLDKLIKIGTNSVWSHIAFLIKVENLKTIIVVESTPGMGVRAIPLLNYLENFNGSGKGYDGRLLVSRYKDFPTFNTNLISKAISLLGNPYNMQEIVDISARIALGLLGMYKSSSVTNGQALICSEFVDICYREIGIEIPYNEEGFIAPADFARCNKISPITYLTAPDAS